MMLLTPIFGISINPAKKVPIMLPIVDNDDIFPDTVPTSCSWLFFNFTAIGDTVASMKLGIPNRNVADIIATIISCCIFCAKKSTIMVSNIGIRLVVIAAINMN